MEDEKMVYKVGGSEEMMQLHRRAMEMTENDFKELAPEDNMLTIWLEDFPQLASEKAGSDVMFCVRGVIKAHDNDDKGTMIQIAMVDASLVHGACGGKKKMMGGLSGYIKDGK